MLTVTQCPYTGPYGLPSSGLKSKGPTATALKRAVSRLGFLVWEPDVWDEHYNQKLSAALAKWDPGASGYGEGRWKKLRAAVVPPGRPNSGEPAFDTVAQQMIRGEHEGSVVPVDPALVKAREILGWAGGFTGRYLYGGGHGKDADDLTRSDALDCSSSTCLLFDHFGLLGVPDYVRVSGWFETWAQAGRGNYVTVHANGDHVWTEFDLPEGYFRFDTSPHGDGPRGPRVRTLRRYDSSFVHRHPEGM